MNLIYVDGIPELCFEDIGKGLIIGLSNKLLLVSICPSFACRPLSFSYLGL